MFCLWHESICEDVTEYSRLTGCKDFKKVAAPFLCKVAEHLDDDESEGELARISASILMRLMWLSRLARPDLLRATAWLATKMHCWYRACDAHLHRVICYLNETMEYLLTGWIEDAPDELFIEMFCDADVCGDEHRCQSTTGGWTQLSGSSGVTQFPLSWVSRRQTAVSRSTTEAETVALCYSPLRRGDPLGRILLYTLGTYSTPTDERR